MSSTTSIAFTIHLPEFVLRVMTFASEHVVYWLMPIALFYEARYLCKKDRLQRIRMIGWGETTRAQQPVFFLFLWSLHLGVTAVFTLAAAAYLLELMGWSH